MPNQLTIKTYPVLLSQIKKIFIEGLQKIEEEKVKAYWRTGQLISEHLLQNKERSDYASKLFDSLGEDLDIDKRTLQRAVKFYRVFPIAATWPQLSWSHYRLLITVDDEKKRKVFLDKAVDKEWDCRRLEEGTFLNQELLDLGLAKLW